MTDTIIGAGTIPQAFTPLIGRDREIAAVDALLRTPGTRLVTLTGPGGVGKSRLAAASAEASAQAFGAGVLFVSLAELDDPALLESTIAAAAGIMESAGGSALHDISSRLNERDTLLVLDNLEHLPAAADTVSALLRLVPRLTILATSRELLRISGEHVFVVPPLALPERAGETDNEAVCATGAVQLFVTRARAVRPGFHPTGADVCAIAEITRRLDGLPLAIELAAARSNVLSPPAMLARLDHSLALLTSGFRDQPARQQTLRGAIAWSYDLLPEPERRVFRALSGFAGGCSLDAAEWLAATFAPSGDNGSEPAPFELIASLVDKSLLFRDERLDGTVRLHMLTTIRAFGLEQLANEGETDRVLDAITTWVHDLILESAPAMIRGARHTALARMEAEIDNIRLTLDRLEQRGDADRLLAVTGEFGFFWYFSGRLGEGRSRFQRALRGSAPATRRARAKALIVAARLSAGCGDDAEAVAWGNEGLALAREEDDTTLIGLGLSALAALAEHRGDDALAAELFTGALESFRLGGDALYAAYALVNLGDTHYRLGDLAGATRWSDEALAATAALGDDVLTAFTLANVGQLALARDDLNAARAAYGETLALGRSTGHHFGIADAITGFAGVAIASNQPALAARWLGAAQANCDALGLRLVPHHRQAAKARAAALVALGDAGFTGAWSEGRNLALADAMAEVEQWIAGTTAIAPPSRETSRFGLSAREIDVLRLVATGLTTAQIADRLFLSPHTVRTHLNRVYAKLDITSRAEAVRFAYEHGFS